MKKIFLTLVFVASIFSVKAQEPTLEETVDFIKLKLSGSNLWYTPSSQVTTSGCEIPYSYHFQASSIKFLDKELIFSNTSCNTEGKLVLFLSKIKGAELVTINDKNIVALLAPEPFFEVSYGGKNISPSRPNKIVIYLVDNPEKLLKAFKHLFKLLDIPLINDKF